jgi:hypothetical protein
MLREAARTSGDEWRRQESSPRKVSIEAVLAPGRSRKLTASHFLVPTGAEFAPFPGDDPEN